MQKKEGRVIQIKTVILYSTGCPKCRDLRDELSRKGIDYEEHNSIQEMLSLGITKVPYLGVGGKLLDFTEAMEWVAGCERGENT